MHENHFLERASTGSSYIHIKLPIEILHSFRQPSQSISIRMYHRDISCSMLNDQHLSTLLNSNPLPILVYLQRGNKLSTNRWHVASGFWQVAFFAMCSWRPGKTLLGVGCRCLAHCAVIKTNIKIGTVKIWSALQCEWSLFSRKQPDEMWICTCIWQWH